MLLITNIAMCYFFLKKDSSSNLLFKMSGQSEMWKVTDYEVSYLSDYKICESGNANVTYLGNYEDLELVNVTFYDMLLGGTKPSGELSGNSIKSGFDIGGSSIKGELPNYINKDYLKQINDNTYLIIEWTECNGDKKSERVDLKIDINLKKTKKIISEEEEL